jgi:acyl carrier protein
MKNIVKPTVTEIVYDHILNNQAVVVDTVDASMSLDKLNIDSLEKISLAMDLEEHFEIDVSDQQIEAFVTVAEIIDLIQLRLAAQPSMEELAEIQRSDIAQLELESSVR